MDKKILLSVLFLGLIVLISACSTTKQDNTNEQVKTQEPEFSKKTSQSTVTIELEPHIYVDGIMDVDIYLNTHSVDMSPFDLKKQVKLVVGDKEYYPVDAPTLKGHHNSGTLRFEVPEKPADHSIIITGIPDIEKRVFTWP